MPRVKHNWSPCDRPHISHISTQFSVSSWQSRNSWLFLDSPISPVRFVHSPRAVSSSTTAVLIVPPWQQPQPWFTDGPLKQQCSWSRWTWSYMCSALRVLCSVFSHLGGLVVGSELCLHVKPLDSQCCYFFGLDNFLILGTLKWRPGHINSLHSEMRKQLNKIKAVRKHRDPAVVF